MHITNSLTTVSSRPRLGFAIYFSPKQKYLDHTDRCRYFSHGSEGMESFKVNKKGGDILAISQIVRGVEAIISVYNFALVLE